MKKLVLTILATGLASGLQTTTAYADKDHAVNQKGAIHSPAAKAKHASFDILAAHAHRKGNLVTFHMTARGDVGKKTPKAHGKLNSAAVFSYVWPTSLDPSAVGFEGKTGILALAATNHPDFDDTPLYDENGDGNLANDGGVWHSHWVVLTPTKACGKDALAVRDIPKGQTPKMPLTWPGLPIFIDSPGYTPQFKGPEVKVVVPFSSAKTAKGAKYCPSSYKMGQTAT